MVCGTDPSELGPSDFDFSERSLALSGISRSAHYYSCSRLENSAVKAFVYTSTDQIPKSTGRTLRM